MNRYDIKLREPSKQTILPVMHIDGRVIGFYPIAETTFTGNEATYTTTDGVEVPLKVVTVDANQHLRAVTQYVAAVFEPVYGIRITNQNEHIAHTHEPWASSDLVKADPTAYRLFRMPTLTWFMHYNQGTYIGALQYNLAPQLVAPTPNTPPEAENAEMKWNASIDYLGIFGECPFFDFNWVTAFKVKSKLEPLRLVIIENPAPTPPATTPPIVAKIIGYPVAVGNGAVMYDTVRILKIADTVEKGDYIFKFQVVDTKDLRTDVTFTLTVK